MCSCKKVIKGLDALLWNDLQIMLLNEKKKKRSAQSSIYTTLPFVHRRDCIYEGINKSVCMCIYTYIYIPTYTHIYIWISFYVCT